MNSKIKLLFFFFMLFGGISFSQTNYNLSDAPKTVFVLADGNFGGIVDNTFHLPQKAPFLFFLNAPQFSFEQNNNLHYFRYEIPRGAIFCRMENQLRNTFNIWIKVRAGTDESYNVIRPQ